MSKAPWKDFEGGEIQEGDTLKHPSGQQGKVLFYPSRAPHMTNQWVVDYGDGVQSRLCLQIGDKGRGVSVSLPLACLFCGNNNVIIEPHHDESYVACRECGCSGPTGTYEECVILWNNPTIVRGKNE